MKILKATVLIMAVLALVPVASYAASATASATVTAQVPVATRVSLVRDANSVTRGSATNILIDRLDGNDPGVTNPNFGFMYAPYRSETGKNWHVADMVANGASMSLSISVTGSVGSTPLSSLLKLWCGGFYTPGATTPISGTASTDWEFANGWQRSLARPFIGTAPFNYRLDVSSVPGGQTYTGSVTFTLTSN